MRSITSAALLSAAVLAIGGCGHADKAGEGATADTVEMPAEEAMSETTGMPSDVASDAEDDADDSDDATAGASEAP